MEDGFLDFPDIGGRVDSGCVEIISWDIADDFSVSQM